MSRSSELVVKAFLDAKDFERGANLVVRNLDAIKAALTKQGKGTSAIDEETRKYKLARTNVQNLRKAIDELSAAQTKLTARTGTRTGLGLGDNARTLLQTKDRQDPQQGTASQLGAAVSKGNAQLEMAKQLVRDLSVTVKNEAEKSGAAFDHIAESVIRYRHELAKIKQAAQSGSADVANNVRQRVQQEIEAIQGQLREIDKATGGQLDSRSQRALEEGPILQKRAADQAAVAKKLQDQIAVILEKQNGLSGEALQKSQDLVASKNFLLQLARQEQQALSRKADKVGVRATDTRKLSGIESQYRSLQQKLVQLENTQRRLGDSNAFARMNPEIERVQNNVRELNRLIELEDQSEAQRIEKIKAANIEMAKLVKLQKEAANKAIGGNRRANEDQMKKSMEAQVPGINRLFNNVFNDMSRRFVATLQFAISGAIIFGAQRFVREFVEAAIEVQRAFADISTALEFDIIEPRGTIEFEHQVESVRQEVLLLSREFNVLPTEANKAAFVMVSRFNDVQLALQATRSQLLATKISTIDQSEVLRALTAVSETYSASIYGTNVGLTIQEKLFAKESASAALYGRVLDDAVRIQQEFGIEVEDTLEGTARAAEAFRQMGFSLQETEALVSSVSRQLGQTGQQSAERLVRSLGQLTDPKIRESLLDIAGASKEFTLSISDFENGAIAWAAIADEFERIEGVNPVAAQQILQTIGQRRELEAVAAALGTVDMQRDMVDAMKTSAGAAEDRFSVLARTVAEVIASIAAGFQELATHFEKLGGITALQLLLEGVDKFLGVINSLLVKVIELKEFFDKLFSVAGIGLGTATVKALTLGLALTTTLRVAKALRDTFHAMAVTNVGSMLANFFKAGAAINPGSVGVGAMLTARGGGAALGSQAAVNVAAATGIRKLGISAIVGASTIRQMSASALAAIPVWGWIAAAGALLIFGFVSMSNKLEGFAQAVEDDKERMKQANIEARAEILAGELTGADARRVEIEKALREKRLQLETSSSSQLSLLEQAFKLAVNTVPGARVLDAFGPDEPEIIGGLVEGSSEFFAKQISDLVAEQVQLNIDRVREDLASGPQTTPDDYDGGYAPDALLERLGIRGSVFPGLGVGNSQVDVIAVGLAFLETELARAEELRADTSGTQGDIDARLVEAQNITDDAYQTYAEIMSVFGLLPDDLTKSVKQLDREISRINSDVFHGKITKSQSIDALRRYAADYQALADEYFETFGEDSEDGLQTADKAADTLQKAIEEAFKLVLEGVNRVTQFGDERSQIQGKIKAYQAEAARIISSGQMPHVMRTEQYIAVQDAIREMRHRLEEIALEEALQYFKDGQALSRSFSERRSFTLGLINELRNQAAKLRQEGNNTGADAKEREALLAAFELEKAALEESIAKNTANIKLAAPALDGRADIRSQIAAVKARIIYSKDATEIATFQQELREIEAQALQAELARLTALTLSKVSLRDTMRSQLVGLSALRRESELTAKLYGATALETFKATRAVESAEVALLDLALQLESVNRQLGKTFDVTNPLDAAAENVISISRALQVPDLGEVEKAALDLELKNAQAARISASFNDGLFNLKFQFERGDIGLNGYIESLRGMLGQVDVSTRAGKELWLQINSLIEGLVSDISGQAFNIPGEIRIPTLFEVRRAVQAEALGVNYLDNRQQNINVYVSDEVQVAAVFEAIAGAFEVDDVRNAPGGAGITLGVLG